ncbi:hypothetical protein NMY22_g12572 [Coprinellus aureogranulatus]|nr:hypothetical protein NMY22_g12572 [Coprinellus aureogranulatus]
MEPVELQEDVGKRVEEAPAARRAGNQTRRHDIRRLPTQDRGDSQMRAYSGEKLSPPLVDDLRRSAEAEARRLTSPQDAKETRTLQFH